MAGGMRPAIARHFATNADMAEFALEHAFQRARKFGDGPFRQIGVVFLNHQACILARDSAEGEGWLSLGFGSVPSLRGGALFYSVMTGLVPVIHDLF